jgi:type III pantothenate kinase
MERIILTDIGNTVTGIAAFINEKVVCKKTIPTRSVSENNIRSIFKYFAEKYTVSNSAVSSVVPENNKLVSRCLNEITGVTPFFIDGSMETGARMNYPEPLKLGSDRLANIAGAVYLYNYPAIILDCGTALTFDAVNNDNEYMCGVIAPGITCFSEYLSNKTALLPDINPELLFHSSLPAVGSSTKEAMAIGIKTGYTGMVKAIVEKIELSLKTDTCNIIKCVTGGCGKLLADVSGSEFVYNRDLTFIGIARIYQINSI